jgi:hypothetical protein
MPFDPRPEPRVAQTAPNAIPHAIPSNLAREYDGKKRKHAPSLVIRRKRHPKIEECRDIAQKRSQNVYNRKNKHQIMASQESNV